jgi:hypothetical protein
VKTVLGEANHGRFQNLGATIERGLYLGLRHRVVNLNERSFIVKFPLCFVIPSEVEESLTNVRRLN